MGSIESRFHQTTASYSLSDVSSESFGLTDPTVIERRKICEPTTSSSPRPISKTDWKSPAPELESKTETTSASSSAIILLSDDAIRPSTADFYSKELTHLNRHHEDDSLISSVSFVGCQSPDELFFRSKEMMEKFLKVHNAMYTHFEEQKASATNKEPINFDVGFLCSVNHGDRWYRAQVVDMERYPDVVVFLLDKGFTFNVAASQIQRIPDGLEGIPSTLIHCSLQGISPPSGSVWEETVAQL